MAKDTEHQWVLIATYEYPQTEIARMLESREPALLSHAQLLNITGPACFRCESFWDEGRSTPCPGGERMPKTTLKLTRSGLIEELHRE